MGEIINRFTGDLIPNPYKFEEVKKDEDGTKGRGKNKPRSEESTPFPPRSDDGRRVYTEQDLFLWALLLNRRDLAVIFWRIGKDHIGAALVACGIFKHMKRIALDDGEVELAGVFRDNAYYFEHLATDVLTKAYEQDKERAHMLLFRGLPYYGNETPLTLANQNNCLDFMSHSAVQTKMSSIWMGSMSINISNWKILLNLIIPFLFLRLIFPKKMRRRRRRGIKQHQKNRKEDTIEEHNKDQADLVEGHSMRRERFRRQERKQFKEITFGKAVHRFYNAPVIKFLFNAISNIAFLLIICYLTMVELSTCEIKSMRNATFLDFHVTSRCVSVVELVVWVWVSALFLEEIRQVSSYEQRSLVNKLQAWWSSGWNKFDIVILTLFIVVVIARFIVPDENFHIIRNLYAILMSLYFMRFMQTYYVNRFVGPKVVMIAKMLGDIAFFLVIFIVYLFAYGAAAQALLYPNSVLEWNLIKKIVYQPYFQIYGELNLDEPEGKNDGATQSSLVVILFAVYMLLTNVLMLSLLIAMFGYTFENIQKKSMKIWAYKRHDLVFEFVDRPILPPPLIIIPVIMRMFRRIYHWYKYGYEYTYFKSRPRQEFILEIEKNRQMSAFEQQCKEQALNERMDQERWKNGDTFYDFSTEKEMLYFRDETQW